jgi:lysozyme family protein
VALQSPPTTTPMASFKLAIARVINNEGGYGNNPADPGGETKYGISKRQYPDLDIQNLTLEQAMEIYRRDFWDPAWEALPQEVATKLLDMAVNMGRETAVKIVQRAAGVVPDGKLGPLTTAAIQNQDAVKLLQEIRARAAVHYARLVLANPALHGFLLGWMRRAVQ